MTFTTAPAAGYNNGMEFFGIEQVYSDSGVDLTLLRHNLRLTPTERWEQNFRALTMRDAFREAGRARRARTAATPDRPAR